MHGFVTVLSEVQKDLQNALLFAPYRRQIWRYIPVDTHFRFREPGVNNDAQLTEHTTKVNAAVRSLSGPQLRGSNLRQCSQEISQSHEIVIPLQPRQTLQIVMHQGGGGTQVAELVEY